MLGRKWLWAVGAAGALGLGALGVDRLVGAAPEVKPQELKPAVSLPVGRVVLFSSGVGYFAARSVLRHLGVKR